MRDLHAIALVIAMAGSEELSAQPSLADGRAAAEIVAPLTVSRETDLEFGAIVSSSQSGTVTVSPIGETVTSGGSRSACCKASRAARFSVDGEAGRAYTISVPASVIAHGDPVRGSTGSVPDLFVDNITLRTQSQPGSGACGVLDSSGRDWFGVGGTLHVPRNVPPSVYKAIVPVTVVYG